MFAGESALQVLGRHLRLHRVADHNERPEANWDWRQRFGWSRRRRLFC